MTENELTRQIIEDPELIRKVLETREGQKLIPEFVRLFEQANEYLAACKREPMLGYIPNGPQDRFHRSQVRGRVMSGSNRTGKSTAIVAAMRAHAKGYRDWLPEGHPNRDVKLHWVKGAPPIQVPNRARLYVNDYKAWDRDVRKEWEHWVPSNEYKYVRAQKNITEIQMTNGSVIFIMTNEMKQEASEGGEVHWVAYNEPPKRPHFIAAQRGLTDTNGPWFAAMTILDAEPWVFEQIYTAAIDDPQIEIFEATFEDNLIENGGVLTREGIAEFAKFLTEDEKQARLYGKPLQAAGQVMKPYARRHPYYIEKHPLPAGTVFFNFIDPHPKKPFASLWLAVDPENEQVYAVADLYEPCRDLNEFVKRVRKIESQPLDFYDPKTGKQYTSAMGRPYMRFIDPQAKQRDPISGLNVHRELANRGIHCRPWSRADKETKIIKARSWLYIQDSCDLPKIQIWESAPRLDFEMTNFFWNPKTGKVIKYNDDCIDCLLAAIAHDIIRLARSANGISRSNVEATTRRTGGYIRAGY